MRILLETAALRFKTFQFSSFIQHKLFVFADEEIDFFPLEFSPEQIQKLVEIWGTNMEPNEKLRMQWLGKPNSRYAWKPAPDW